MKAVPLTDSLVAGEFPFFNNCYYLHMVAGSALCVFKFRELSRPSKFYLLLSKISFLLSLLASSFLPETCKFCLLPGTCQLYFLSLVSFVHFLNLMIIFRLFRRRCF